MTAGGVPASRFRPGSRELLLERVERWALPAILLVAGLNFFWRLGTSSYFVDEAFSLLHSLPSLHTLIHEVNVNETTPYTYFLFLHVWLSVTGSQAEWVTRLPSAVAGVVLVGATYWMARAFVTRRVALGAAGLAAISPLIQSYAQETRVYVFLLVAVVIAVGATVRGCRQAERRRSLLAIGAGSAFVAIWLHYTAVSIILPLAVWVATRSELSRRQRGAFVAVCVAGVASVMPLLLEQYSLYPNGGDITGSINLRNVVSVTGTPFGTRVGTPLNAWSIGGALIVVVAVLTLLRSRRRQVSEPELLVALAVVGIVGLLGLDLAGKHILITRYTVVTAPFLVTVIAAACVQLPRTPAAVLATGALVVSAAGLVVNHSRSGFYAPVREAVEYLAPRHRPGDFMLSPGVALTDPPILYYDIRFLRPKLNFFGLTERGLAQTAFEHYSRIWIVDKPRSDTRAAALAMVEPTLRRYGFSAESVQTFTTSITLGVMLAVRGSG